jgi:hemolysin III
MSERTQSRGEELANTLSHGAGAIGALVALPVLIVASMRAGSTLAVVGAVVFAVSAFFLYAASTAYHATPRGRAKRILRDIDHIGIFILIAGSYTPFTLGVLRGPWGWSILFAIWTLAILGVIWKVHPALRKDHAPVWLYLLMGWLVVIAARPLWMNLPPAGLAWLAAGGVAYTAGVLFYVQERQPYFHFVWHLFVLAGTTCHFMAIWRYAV